jgi:thioredoxin reductase (NADPH)
MSNARKGLPLSSSRIEKIFPKLTPEQIDRTAAYGRTRSVQPGEVLIEQGDTSVPFFVVITSEVEIVRPFGDRETLITVHGYGEFTGEVNMLSGRRSFFRASGLAAAVYGASEGPDVMVLETSSPGGQAGSSSRIENYLGFPTGISGQDLAARAYLQAQKFGAKMLIAKATRLICDRKPYIIELENGVRISTRTVVIATGAQYRKLPLENLYRFEGAGVYYGATFVEAQLCGGEEVIVVGGGNSAGQAAVFLAQTTKHVHMLVRSSGLAATMSRYLIRRIENSPTITLRPQTEVVTVEGDNHLDSVSWQNSQTGQTEKHEIRRVFVMTGADPNTCWLDGCIALDAKGFITTGPDLLPENLSAADWPLARQPYLLETTLPGVFAVGDVRGGSIKRVASAVGEGSIAISFVHKVLQE